MIRTLKVFVQDKWNIVIDNKHVLLPWLVMMHAGVHHHEVQESPRMEDSVSKRSRTRVPETK